MLDEHERHAGVGGEVLEELGERLQAAGGRADADDRKTVRRRLDEKIRSVREFGFRAFRRR
jgi:hypothetical protein